MSEGREKPLPLVGAPRCTAFPQLQKLVRGSKKWRVLAREGLQHLIFVCELHRKQIDSWRFFLHEDPAQGRSWSVWVIGVVRIVGDQCSFELWCTDAEGAALFRTLTDDKFVEGGQGPEPQVLWRAPALQPSSLRARTWCVSLSAFQLRSTRGERAVPATCG